MCNAPPDISTWTSDFIYPEPNSWSLPYSHPTCLSSSIPPSQLIPHLHPSSHKSQNFRIILDSSFSLLLCAESSMTPHPLSVKTKALAVVWQSPPWSDIPNSPVILIILPTSAHSASATSASWMFLQQTKPGPAPAPVHWHLPDVPPLPFTWPPLDQCHISSQMAPSQWGLC